MDYDCYFRCYCFQWAYSPIMLDDSIKEKLFILLFIILLALSFIIHIPQYIEVWNNNIFDTIFLCRFEKKVIFINGTKKGYL